jgi:hypothetical protein
VRHAAVVPEARHALSLRDKGTGRDTARAGEVAGGTSVPPHRENFAGLRKSPPSQTFRFSIAGPFRPKPAQNTAESPVASLLPPVWSMATHLKTPVVNAPTPMVRWVFRRDGRAITCEVDAHDTQSYDVAIIPHWDPSAAVIERFNRALRALERHASIARRLRDDGWVLVDHAIPNYVGTAA